ncbi:hypothetical protein EGW08_022907 [Elysia chlorotica]|uniref:Presenilin n=1 Tax=Elysia chlorotica TaxID=188477 RepID=A0A3S1AWU2_ELYCH|nr:hypothetical protein EGW08_022907 [Elysia chlorotica]
MNTGDQLASNSHEGSPTERTGLIGGGQPFNTQDPSVRNYRSSETDIPAMASEASVVVNSNTNNPSQRDNRQIRPGPSTAPAESAASSEDEELIYGAKHVIHLFAPVTLCMTVVVATINSVAYYSESGSAHFAYTPFTDERASTSTKLWQSFANAGIVMVGVIVMTILLLVLYKYKFYKIISAWLMISSVMTLFFFSLFYLWHVLRAFNVPMDYITMSIIIWNFGVGGIFCIHWKGPLLVQQGYLIVVSALVALIFIKYFPDWTTWTVLGVMVIWDLIAVLCPKGPLKMLVETAQSRNEQMFPALIYSSAMVWIVTMADDGGKKSQKPKKRTRDGEQKGEVQTDGEDGDDGGFGQHMANGMGGNSVEDSASARSAVRALGDMTQEEPISGAAAEEADGATAAQKNKKRKKRPAGAQGQAESRQRAPVSGADDDQDDERGIKLGLGDFIFYSVLVGKASSNGDWNTTIACFVAIMIGLCCTLLLLAIMRKALPALPISLTFGLVFNFATSALVQPFMDRLNSEQVYI